MRSLVVCMLMLFVILFTTGMCSAASIVVFHPNHWWYTGDSFSSKEVCKDTCNSLSAQAVYEINSLRAHGFDIVYRKNTHLDVYVPYGSCTCTGHDDIFN